MTYYGDYPTGFTTLCMVFDTFAASTGAPTATTNFAAGDIQIYKDGGTTQRSSSAGITVSTSFDSNTGLQMVVIDLSDNTDAGFYAAGHEYQVAVADITADAQTVRFWLGTFSIERAGAALALIKAGTVKVDVDTIKTNPVVNGGTITFPTNKTVADASLLPTALTSNGNMKSSMVEILTTALTETVGQLAGGFKKFFNIAAPAATMDHGVLVDTVTTATTATNLTNAPTNGDLTATMKASVTTAATAATPTAAAVTGAVGSVTGAVGSVTGNVGGNLLGTLTAAERNAIVDAWIARNIAGGSSTGRTNGQAMGSLRNKQEIAGGVITIYGTDDTTPLWDGTVTTAPGDPLSAIDPS